MADLIYMMNTLVNNKGEILVPGIMDDVVPVTDEELATYTTIDFDLEHYKKDIGCKHLLHKTDKVVISKKFDVIKVVVQFKYAIFYCSLKL